MIGQDLFNCFDSMDSDNEEARSRINPTRGDPNTVTAGSTNERCAKIEFESDYKRRSIATAVINKFKLNDLFTAKISENVNRYLSNYPYMCNDSNLNDAYEIKHFHNLFGDLAKFLHLNKIQQN